jgi:hypothetical protein
VAQYHDVAAKVLSKPCTSLSKKPWYGTSAQQYNKHLANPLNQPETLSDIPDHGLDLALIT